MTNKILKEKYNITPRFVNIEDAEFILNLRKDERLGRFLSPTDSDITRQKYWITEYKERERNQEEFYFIFCNALNKYGVNRIYHITSDSFEVGSWLFSPSSPMGLSILADIASRDYAFEKTNVNACRFEVRKLNQSVVKYHRAYNPILEKEDELNYYFYLPKERYILHRNKLLKYFNYESK